MSGSSSVEGEVDVMICGVDVDSLLRALRAEIAQPQPEKGRVRLSAEGNCISLKITSSDISGLRALSNSFLYLIYAATSSINAVERSPDTLQGNP